MECCIKLGRKGPGSPVAVSEPSTSEECFPSLYIDGGKELLDIPASGEMVVKFRRNSVTEGRTNNSLSLDILEIVSVEAGEESSKKEDSGEALDKLKSEMEDEED